MDSEKSIFSSSRSPYYLLGALASILWLGGCTSLKKAGLVGAGALVPGAIASIATSGSAPVLLASAVGASVTSVVADQVMKSPTGNTTLNNCAPDNFWTAIGTAIELGGIYLIIAFVVVPLLLGWLTPGPLERKKKSAS